MVWSCHDSHLVTTGNKKVNWDQLFQQIQQARWVSALLVMTVVTLRTPHSWLITTESLAQAKAMLSLIICQN